VCGHHPSRLNQGGSQRLSIDSHLSGGPDDWEKWTSIFQVMQTLLHQTALRAALLQYWLEFRLRSEIHALGLGAFLAAPIDHFLIVKCDHLYRTQGSLQLLELHGDRPLAVQCFAVLRCDHRFDGAVSSALV